MDVIPQPRVLDADRALTDDRNDLTADQHRARAQELAAALTESCAYAQQLWLCLDQLRSYLVAALPPAHEVSRGAAPSGVDDEQGWVEWMDAYAAVTSVLAGPHGDSGYGSSEAAREAQLRRGRST